MSYAVVQDVPASWEQYAPYATVLAEASPDGLVLHAAGPTDEGFRTIEVWESEAAWARFRLDHPDSLSRALPRPPIARSLELAHVVFGEGVASGDVPREASTRTGGRQ